MGQRHLRILVLVLAYAWVVLMASGSLWWPMGRDQGVYAWVADVIMDGGVPYRDAWDVKGPATFYTYALAHLIFGRSLWAVRALDLILLALAAWAVWRLLRRTVDPVVAHAGPIVLVLMYVERTYWSTAQPDGWGGFMVIYAVAVLTLGAAAGRVRGGGDAASGGVPGDRDGGSTVRRLLAGALLTVAALYKVTLIAFLLPVALYDRMLVRERREGGDDGTDGESPRRGTGAPGDGDPRRWLDTSLLTLVAGSAGAALLAAGLMVWRGSLGPFLDVQLRFNPSVHLLMQDRPWSHHFELVEFLLHYAVVVVVALAIVGMVRAWTRREPLASFAAVAFWVGIGTIVVQQKYYPYHWTPLYPPLAILASCGLDGMRGKARELTEARGRSAAEISRATTAVALGGIVALILSIRPVPDLLGWRIFVAGHGSPDSYYSYFGFYAGGDYSFPADLEVADYLRKHTGPDETVLIWGFEPLVNFLADRGTPTRFGYNYPLVTGEDSPIRRRYRRQFLAELRRSPPAYIGIVEWDQNNLMAKSSRTYLVQFPELYRFLLERYEHDTTIEDFALWRRR